MKETNLKEELFKEIQKRGLLEQEEEEKTDSEDSSEGKIYKLPKKTIELLNERINDEYYAHYLYRSAANWCHDKNYKKAAAFFDADANTELEHAQKIQNYMTDFNILPTISKTETEFKFKDLVDIIHQAYDFELKLMKSYNKNSHEVFADDITTFDFLQEFREIQRESVVEFNDLINGTELVDVNNKLDVLYFEQTYF